MPRICPECNKKTRSVKGVHIDCFEKSIARIKKKNENQIIKRESSFSLIPRCFLCKGNLSLRERRILHKNGLYQHYFHRDCLNDYEFRKFQLDLPKTCPLCQVLFSYDEE